MKTEIETQVEAAISELQPMSGGDTYAVIVLMKQLDAEKIFFAKQLESDSYRGVQGASARIFSLCEAITELRHIYM